MHTSVISTTTETGRIWIPDRIGSRHINLSRHIETYEMQMRCISRIYPLMPCHSPQCTRFQHNCVNQAVFILSWHTGPLFPDNPVTFQPSKCNSVPSTIPSLYVNRVVCRNYLNTSFHNSWSTDNWPTNSVNMLSNFSTGFELRKSWTSS